MENTSNIIINSRLIKDGQGPAYKAIAVSEESMKKLDNDNKKKEINSIYNETPSQDQQNQMQGYNSINVNTPNILPEPMAEKSEIELTPSFNIPEMQQPTELPTENAQINQTGSMFIPTIDEPIYQPMNNDLAMSNDNNPHSTILNPFDISENNSHTESSIENNILNGIPQDSMTSESKPEEIINNTIILPETNNENNMEPTQITSEINYGQIPQFVQPIEASKEKEKPVFAQTQTNSEEITPVQIEPIYQSNDFIKEQLQNNQPSLDKNGFDINEMHQEDTTYKNDAREETIDLEDKIDSILKRSKALEDATRNLSNEIEIVRKIMENDKTRKNEFFSALDNNTYSQEESHSFTL